jgi:hypothetical protein
VRYRHAHFDFHGHPQQPRTVDTNILKNAGRIKILCREPGSLMASRRPTSVATNVGKLGLAWSAPGRKEGA